jgi:hypothetical protein
MKKFQKTASEKTHNALQGKLDIIAQAIADEMIDGRSDLKIQMHINDKTKVLDSLTKYYSVSVKVDPVENNIGEAFNGYRKTTTDASGTGSTGGDRFNPDGTVVRLSTARKPDRSNIVDDSGEDDDCA